MPLNTDKHPSTGSKAKRCPEVRGGCRQVRGGPSQGAPKLGVGFPKVPVCLLHARILTCSAKKRKALGPQGVTSRPKNGLRGLPSKSVPSMEFWAGGLHMTQGSMVGSLRHMVSPLLKGCIPWLELPSFFGHYCGYYQK